MKRIALGLASCLWLAAIAVAGAAKPPQAAYAWILPRGFPAPPVPADNPMSEAKVQLGRHLFYDTRLSGNGAQSCASCHLQAKAFTDGREQSVGSTGQIHPRGSMSLVNVAYARTLNWANPTMTKLEDQALVPMYGDHPIELGLDRNDAWLRALETDQTYRRLFPDAFPGQDNAFTAANVTKALASFERAIVSARSPYDRYHFDRDDAAVSDAAKRGEILFNSRPLSCFTCHGGVNFSSAMGGPGVMRMEFHNTGLYNLAGQVSYPTTNTGLHAATGNPADVGKFKPPTLRNIAVTDPYMHDGSVATLEDAIDHYAAGGRTISSGPSQGVGRNNPNKSPVIRGFAITPAQKADLVEFLRSLTDQALIQDPRFANPWRKQP